MDFVVNTKKKIAFFVLVGDTKKSQSLEAVRSIHPCRPDSDTAESRREWHCCSRQVRSLVAAAAAGRSPKRTYTRRVNIDTCRSTLNNMFSFLFASRLCSLVGACVGSGSMPKNKRHFRPERVARVPYVSPQIGTKFAIQRKSIPNVISHMSSAANAAREMNNKWK